QRMRGIAPPKSNPPPRKAILLWYPDELVEVAKARRRLRDEPELVKALLKHGADPNARTRAWFTILHFAVICRHAGTVKVLLDSKANANAQSWDGFTPLMWAGMDTMPLLLAHGANANIRNTGGDTALMVNGLRGTKLLLDHGAVI